MATCPEVAPSGAAADTSLKGRHEKVADSLRSLETLGRVEVRKEHVGISMVPERTGQRRRIVGS